MRSQRSLCIALSPLPLLHKLDLFQTYSYSKTYTDRLADMFDPSYLSVPPTHSVADRRQTDLDDLSGCPHVSEGQMSVVESGPISTVASMALLYMGGHPKLPEDASMSGIPALSGDYADTLFTQTADSGQVTIAVPASFPVDHVSPNRTPGSMWEHDNQTIAESGRKDAEIYRILSSAVERLQAGESVDDGDVQWNTWLRSDSPTLRESITALQGDPVSTTDCPPDLSPNDPLVTQRTKDHFLSPGADAAEPVRSFGIPTTAPDSFISVPQPHDCRSILPLSTSNVSELIVARRRESSRRRSKEYRERTAMERQNQNGDERRQAILEQYRQRKREREQERRRGQKALLKDTAAVLGSSAAK